MDARGPPPHSLTGSTGATRATGRGAGGRIAACGRLGAHKGDAGNEHRANSNGREP